MIPLSKLLTIGFVGVAGTLVIGYCIYFDRKRRSDPNFKAKLREKRKQKVEKKSGAADIQFPPTFDSRSMQQFFLGCVSKGEESIAVGSFDEAGDYFAAATVVMGEPSNFIQSLQDRLFPPVMESFVKHLPIRRRQFESLLPSPGEIGLQRMVAALQDDALE